MKTCPKCRQEKPETDFYATRTQCKECVSAYEKAAYHANPTRKRKQSAAWRMAHPDENRTYQREWAQEARQDPAFRLRMAEGDRRYIERHPDRYKAIQFNSNLRRSCARYGITVAQYAEMFHVQGGVCAACARAETAKLRNTVKRLAIDHEHATGKVRGLLCASCNLMLGHFNDDETRVLALADYLRAHTGTASAARDNNNVHDNEEGETFPLTPASLSAAYRDVLTRACAPSPELLN